MLNGSSEDIPGAIIDTHWPKLENDANESFLALALTHSTFGVEAGLTPLASWLHAFLPDHTRRFTTVDVQRRIHS